MSEPANTKPKASLTDQLRQLGGLLSSFAPIIFIVFVIGIYGFVAFQILNARSAAPSPTDVSAQTQASASAPHIDQQTIDDMQSLQDNSVNVKTLFDQARSNPFNE